MFVSEWYRFWLTLLQVLVMNYRFWYILLVCLLVIDEFNRFWWYWLLRVFVMNYCYMCLYLNKKDWNLLRVYQSHCRILCFFARAEGLDTSAKKLYDFLFSKSWNGFAFNFQIYQWNFVCHLSQRFISIPTLSVAFWRLTFPHGVHHTRHTTMHYVIT